MIRVLLLSIFCLSLTAGSAHCQLTLADVQTIIAQASSHAARISPDSVIAVVDREGFVLGVWRLGSRALSPEEIALAVSKAGTAAYLSSNQHAFTSRTAGFIVRQHFPPGVKNKPPGPLVGVGFSNLFFSDINKYKGPGSTIVHSSQPGLSITAVPGTSLNASPGGVPLYKGGKLVGGIGVTGDGTEGFVDVYDKDEDVALAGQRSFEPSEVIFGSGVAIDGIRIPYVKKATSPGPGSPFGTIGAPSTEYSLTDSPRPFPYPEATLGGVTGEVRQPIISDPLPGLIQGQPRLSNFEVRTILALAAKRAAATRAGIRLPQGKVPAQVFITVVNNPASNGVAPVVLGTFRTPDATMFSWDVCVQKARTALFFSRKFHRAYSTRTVGFLSQKMYPPGIDGTSPGPLFGLQQRISVDPPPKPELPNGMTIFPGGFPLYRNGVLVGAIGISGDGVDQDDLIGAAGTVNFLAAEALRADQIFFRGARLPYAKFPRNPEL